MIIRRTFPQVYKVVHRKTGWTYFQVSARSAKWGMALTNHKPLVGYYAVLTFVGLRPSEGARVQWEAQETVAVDAGSGRLSAAEPIWARFGFASPSYHPAGPTETNLHIGLTPMWWSAGGGADGYVYFAQENSTQLLWQIAPCSKTNLLDLIPQDFLTTFVSQKDKTNGLAAFGTNWLGHAIRVRQGQIILARLVSDPVQVYALEFAEQNMSDAVVYYLKKPQ